MRTWITALRLYSLPASLLPTILVVLIGASQSGSPDWLAGLAASIGAIVLHWSVNLLNDVEDFRRGIDTLDNNGGSGVLAREHLSPRALTIAALVLMVLASLGGIPLALKAPTIAAISVAVGAVCALGYSAPRVGLKYTGLGEWAVFLGMGPLLTNAISVAWWGSFSAHTTLAGIFTGGLSVVLLHANNIEDHEADSGAGARTLAIRMGRSNARRLLLALVIGLGALAFLWISSRSPIATIALAPLALVMIRTTRHASSPSPAGFREAGIRFHMAGSLSISLAWLLIVASGR